MRQIDVTPRDLAILEFVLDDLVEAIDDGDRPEFSRDEAQALLETVLSIKGPFVCAVPEQG
jgi:hypothetical protein